MIETDELRQVVESMGIEPTNDSFHVFWEQNERVQYYSTDLLEEMSNFVEDLGDREIIIIRGEV